MKHTFSILFITFAVASALAKSYEDGDPDNDEQYESDAPVTGPQPQLIQKPQIPPAINAAPAASPASSPKPTKAGVKAHAMNAKEAASVAKQAAVVANKVATHSVKVTHHAKKALKHALHALHGARVESAGLDKQQKDSLKKAEARLREATKTADH